jgi:hypothetical protein
MRSFRVTRRKSVFTQPAMAVRADDGIYVNAAASLSSTRS